MNVNNILIGLIITIIITETITLGFFPRGRGGLIVLLRFFFFVRS